MLQHVILRLVVRHSLPGVALCVQRGRDLLVAPTTVSADTVTFELQLEAKARPDGSLVLRGLEVQGPASGRFIYINAGTYAGQIDSPWGRRAKIPLGELTSEMLALALARPNAVIVAAI